MYLYAQQIVSCSQILTFVHVDGLVTVRLLELVTIRHSKLDLGSLGWILTFVHVGAEVSSIMVAMYIAQTASDSIDLAPAIVLFLTLVLSGLLVAWAGKRAVDGKLPRNWMIGIRTKETIASDEAWRVSHIEAGKYFVVAGLVSIFTGLAIIPRPANAVAAVVVILGSIFTLVPVVVAGFVAQRTAKEINSKS